jgi:hypothetical protein
MKMLIFAAALVAASFSTAAVAGASQASFAYTEGQGVNVRLRINGTTNLTALHRGWVDDFGTNNGGGAFGNYLTGICGTSDNCNGSDQAYRNYFVFDLANIIGAITSAELRLDQPLNRFSESDFDGYISTQPSHIYTLWDTDVSGSSLSLARGVGLFNDLGGGVAYGSTTVSAAKNGTIVGVTFNAAGLAALNNYAQQGQRAAFGGALDLVGGAVPEPASWAMMIAGFGFVGAAARRRTKASLA